MIETELGKIIKQIRKAKGLSQADLGDMLGFSQSAIYKYENELSKPGHDFIKAFRDVMKYDLTSENITKVVTPVQSEPNQQDMNTDMESRRTLERTLENMSEDKIRSTAIIERLVALLEHSFSSNSPGPEHQQPSPIDKTKDHQGAAGRLGLNKRKEKEGRDASKHK